MSQENDYIENEDLLEETDEVEETELNDVEDNEEAEQVDWRARALKAEKAIIKSKTKKQKPVKKESVSTNQSQIDLLRFNGVTSTEIEQLQKISALEGIDLIDAKNSELFNLWKQKNEQEAKTKQATMPTSKRGRVVSESLDTVKQRIMKGTATAEDFARVRSGK